jgi:hypothetical protein
MVASWPIPYIPYLDPEVKIDPAGAMHDGLRGNLKESISFYQTEIALMTRIKELAKGDPEIQALCSSIIWTEILMIRLQYEEINDPCE